MEREGESLTSVGSEFQSEGAEKEKDLRPAQDFINGSESRFESEDRKGRAGM